MPCPARLHNDLCCRTALLRYETYHCSSAVRRREERTAVGLGWPDRAAARWVRRASARRSSRSAQGSHRARRCCPGPSWPSPPAVPVRYDALARLLLLWPGIPSGNPNSAMSTCHASRYNVLEVLAYRRLHAQHQQLMLPSRAAVVGTPPVCAIDCAPVPARVWDLSASVPPAACSGLSLSVAAPK